MRTEAADRIEGNRALLERDRHNLRIGLDEWEGVYRQRGLPDDMCVQAARLKMLPGMGLPPPYGPIETDAERGLERDVSTLRAAETYVVSPPMHDVIVAAAQSLTIPRDLGTFDRESDLPSPTGFLLLPDVQLVESPDGEQHDVLACSWNHATVPFDPDEPPLPGVRVTTYLDANGPVQTPEWTLFRRAAKQSGHPLPRLVPDERRWLRGDAYLAAATDDQITEDDRVFHIDSERYEDTIRQLHDTTDSSATTAGEYAGGTCVADPDGTFARRYMFAFWRLCQQRIATVSRFREDRDADGPPMPADVVRVVQLRAFNPEAADQQQQGPTPYHHRWVVRMHKVRQWYPALGVHKVIWRGPYLKGPDGAPLLAGDKTHALIR